MSVGPTPSEAAIAAALAAKTKPPGSLGRLETLAAQLARVQGTLSPRADRQRVVVFAADHGVTAEGVSAYPSAVTAEMVRTFCAGGAAVSVLARAVGADVEVVDVGVATPLPDLTPDDPTRGARYRVAPVARGTQNFRHGAAMTPAQCATAMAVGAEAVSRAQADGVQVLALGEMGIGNTTAAAAVLALLTDRPAHEVAGRGTGVDEAGLARKITVIADATARVRQQGSITPLVALAEVGGFELAAIAGAVLAARGTPLVLVIDGFIATVAALVAIRHDPTAHAACVLAHRSAEQGHAVAIAAIGLDPLLDLSMRLGEGSGAVLALPLVRAAADMLREMATFESAGVSGAVS